MKKLACWLVAVLAICPVILISSFAIADASSRVSEPQDIDTLQQLDYYVSQVNNINSKLINTRNQSSRIPATITFADYLTFDDLQAFAETYDIQLKQIQLRGLMPDGTRVTIATLVHKGMAETEELMYEQALDQGFELLGITDVYADILPSSIAAMSANEVTYLVDTVGNVGEDLSLASTLSSSRSDNESASTTYPKSLTWELENLNLMPLQVD